MDLNWKYLLIPVISAFIGWLTNWIAIKMLFNPKRPIDLKVWVLQGILYRRQKDIAHKLADTIESKLFSHSDLYEILTSDKFLKDIMPVIEKAMEDFVTHKLKSIHPLLDMIPGAFLDMIKEKLMEIFEDLIPRIMDGAGDVLENQIDIKIIIRDKIEAFDVSELENVLLSILKSEFRMIEYIGGVLGFVIGITQLVIANFL